MDELAQTLSLATIVRIVVVVVLGIGLYLVGRMLSKRFESALREKRPDDETRKRAQTVGQLIRYALGIVIGTAVVIVVLGHLGVSIGPILGAAGIAGIAVGFGAQRIVQDVISGFFILIDDQIRVGDVVEVAGKVGLVESVDLRMTVLRDLQGDVHYIRHGQVDVVTNKTKGFAFYVFDIGVAYKEDTDEVVAVMKQVGEELLADEHYGDYILEPVQILGVDRFENSAVIIKGRIRTRAMKKWDVGREYNRRLKARFDEVGIEIPFPHVTVYMGHDKSGGASPLHVVTSDAEPPAPSG